MLELRQLRYFVAACDAAQLTRAAAQLNIAQPALSQAIAQLEAQLGAPLLERHARGVQPTATGELLLVRARQILGAALDAEAAVAGAVRAEHGQLRIGFLSLTSPAMAGGIFPGFTRRHPDIAVQWVELGFPGEDVIGWLSDVDVALSYVVEPEPVLEMLVLRAEPVVAVVGADHPLADRRELRVADIVDETFVKLDEGIRAHWRDFWLLEPFRSGPVRYSSEMARTPQEAAAQVVAGRGVLTTPGVVAAQFAHLGVAGIPLVDAPPALLALVWAPGQSNAHVRTLVDFGREHASRSVAA